MEPVTHFLTGACLGRAGFNRKAAYATLAMTLAAETPDLDILWGFRGPLVAFQHHRGFTHTFSVRPWSRLWSRSSAGAFIACDGKSHRSRRDGCCSGSLR